MLHDGRGGGSGAAAAAAVATAAAGRGCALIAAIVASCLIPFTCLMILQVHILRRIYARCLLMSQEFVTRTWTGVLLTSHCSEALHREVEDLRPQYPLHRIVSRLYINYTSSAVQRSRLCCTAAHVTAAAAAPGATERPARAADYSHHAAVAPAFRGCSKTAFCCVCCWRTRANGGGLWFSISGCGAWHRQGRCVVCRCAVQPVCKWASIRLRGVCVHHTNPCPPRNASNPIQHSRRGMARPGAPGVIRGHQGQGPLRRARLQDRHVASPGCLALCVFYI